VSGGGISPSVTGTSLYFFSAYQGPQGVQGNAGVQGTPGVQGNQGAQGIQGVQGIVAINGYTTNGSNQLVTTGSDAGSVKANSGLTWVGSTLNIGGNIASVTSINNTTIGGVVITSGALSNATAGTTLTITGQTSAANIPALTVIPPSGSGTGYTISAGGSNLIGGVTLNGGAITAAGALAMGNNAITGVTTISAGSGSSTIGGVTLNGGAITGATTITNSGLHTTGSLSTAGTVTCGAITAPTTANTINSLVINAGTCTGVDFVATSDRRLKSDISTISNALGIVNNMRGVYFTRLGQSKRSVGVIAQEVEEVLPEVVHTGDDEMKSVSYGNIVGLLIEANKELTQRLESLEKLMVMK
jgi:hypothetical protein